MVGLCEWLPFINDANEPARRGAAEDAELDHVTSVGDNRTTSKRLIGEIIGGATAGAGVGDQDEDDEREGVGEMRD